MYRLPPGSCYWYDAIRYSTGERRGEHGEVNKSGWGLPTYLLCSIVQISLSHCQGTNAEVIRKKCAILSVFVFMFQHVPKFCPPALFVIISTSICSLESTWTTWILKWYILKLYAYHLMGSFFLTCHIVFQFINYHLYWIMFTCCFDVVYAAKKKASKQEKSALQPFFHQRVKLK